MKYHGRIVELADKAELYARTLQHYNQALFDTLPKTQTEKVKRAALRKLGERGLTPATWDHEEKRYWSASNGT